jgi:hypothetical protein
MIPLTNHQLSSINGGGIAKRIAIHTLVFVLLIVSSLVKIIRRRHGG